MPRPRPAEPQTRQEIRLPESLRRAMVEAAAVEGLPVSALWRRAAEAELARIERSKKAGGNA